jgi:hypothetical protein
MDGGHPAFAEAWLACNDRGGLVSEQISWTTAIGRPGQSPSFRLRCSSFRSAFASIWRMRSTRHIELLTQVFQREASVRDDDEPHVTKSVTGQDRLRSGTTRRA